MAKKTSGNGAVAAVEKPVKLQIPKRIRKFINEAFDCWAHASDQAHDDLVQKDKKEVLAYINGLLKQLPVA